MTGWGYIGNWLNFHFRNCSFKICNSRPWAWGRVCVRKNKEGSSFFNKFAGFWFSVKFYKIVKTVRTRKLWKRKTTIKENCSEDIWFCCKAKSSTRYLDKALIKWNGSIYTAQLQGRIQEFIRDLFTLIKTGNARSGNIRENINLDFDLILHRF